jgi:Copper transport outer membrane protein, MctB
VVNIRFHLVSLVAVFFALAIGIGVGSSVVRAGVLERTEAQLQSLDQTLGKRNEQIRRLKKAADLDAGVDRGVNDRFFEIALRGTPVLIVKLPGADDRELRALTTMLKTSNADVTGVATFSARVRLGPEVDSRFAAIRIGSYSTSVDAVSSRLRELSTSSLSYGSEQRASIRRLSESGFVSLVGSNGKAVSELTVSPETRFVVVGTRDPKTKNTKPFVSGFLRALVTSNPRRVIVTDAEAPLAISGKNLTLPADSLVEFVRRASNLSKKTSTIDGSLTSKGVDGRIRRAALTLLLMDGEKSKVGHFGTAPSATALVPGQPTKP